MKESKREEFESLVTQNMEVIVATLEQTVSKLKNLEIEVGVLREDMELAKRSAMISYQNKSRNRFN